MKQKTKEERSIRRTELMEKGMTSLQAGNSKKAHEFFSSCVKPLFITNKVPVTPYMAFEWIKQLKKEGIQFIVAPYGFFIFNRRGRCTIGLSLKN